MSNPKSFFFWFFPVFYPDSDAKVWKSALPGEFPAECPENGAPSDENPRDGSREGTFRPGRKFLCIKCVIVSHFVSLNLNLAQCVSSSKGVSDREKKIFEREIIF